MTTNIVSLNTRGLRNQLKRRAVFDLYRTKCDILCLQETHSCEADEKVWTTEWGGQVLFSHGTNNARGVMVLIRKNYAKVEDVYISPSGRNVQCVIKVHDVNFCLSVIYAPNTDSPAFFDEVFHSAFNKSSRVVIIGDFNTVMDTSIDRSSAMQANTNNNLSTRRIHELKDEMQMCDIWRVRNEQERRYSWFRKGNGKQASRLDYAVISNGLKQQVHNSFYMCGLESDHSAYVLGVEFMWIDRGTGFWKLNTTLLYEKEYIESVNQILDETDNMSANIQPEQQWEIVKDRVKQFSINYARNRTNDERIAVSQLSEYISHTEDVYDQLDQEGLKLLNTSKEELDELMKKRIRGVMFRSKAKWYVEGEKNTKYFYNLEKSRYNAKVCTRVINSAGQEISGQEDVLLAQAEFYQELYTSDRMCTFELHNQLENRLEGESVGTLEDQITDAEITDAVRGMKNGSCPGSDGLPAEFYKVFWTKIRRKLLSALTASFREKKLYGSTRMGILNLIPKGEKDTRFLKNLRPITLLNTDYKILEKTIANRMTPCLSELIHEDQKGFLPNRKIAANIRRILDIVEETQAPGQEQEGLIMSCDFLKCFDRIEIVAVIKSMEYFGFSRILTDWVEIMYSGFELRIQNNGHFSPKFVPH